jgi:TolB protein
MNFISFLPLRHWFGVVLAFCSLGLFSSCQEDLVEPAYFGSVSGTVLDARTNLPLANATVTTNPATSSFVTTAQGKFDIKDAPTGRLAITVSKADYQQVVANVTVNDGQTADVSVLLSKSTTAAISAPNRPTPATQATGQPTDVRLSWRRVNATAADSLRFDVVLFESNSTSQRTLLNNSRDTTVLATNLKFNTTYFWQVTARNPAGATAKSDIWSFQTRDLPSNRFVYARTVNGNTDIYSSNETGGDLLRLTSAATVETAPQLSPNGDFVAYTSNATGQFQLYTMNRDGSNQRRITTLAVEGYNNAGIGYRWSPDGAQLIYSHYDQLLRVNRDGTGLIQLATAPAGRHFRECDWTAQNGGRLVVQTVGPNPYDAELYLYSVNGANPVQFVGNLPGRLDSPSFSINGLSVLYSRDVAGFNDPGGRQLDTHMFIQRIDGTSTVDVTTGGAGTSASKPAGTNDVTPRYSPDGFRLIFVNTVNDERSAPDVYTMDLDGRSRTRLFQNAFLPDWK